MSRDLQTVTRVLRELLKTLPAIKNSSSRDAVRRHLELIAYFQRQYDLLVNQPVLA